MTRLRWKVAEKDFFCLSCDRVVGLGEIHIGHVYIRCSMPRGGAFPTAIDCPAWTESYYSELTRAVRSRLGYEPDP